MKARFILSRSKALEQYKIVRELCDSVSYSVKTNPLLADILEQDTDSFFSIHFASSLRFVEDKGRVWFLAQGWTLKEVEELLKQGIKSFVVDNENDFKILMQFLENNAYKINLLLRMRLKERTVHTERHYVFGMPSSAVNELIAKLRENTSIDRLGIHFHRKSQNISEWELKQELCELLTEETLKSIDILNIGGGIPVQYKNHQADATPYVFDKITELRRWLSGYNIKLIIEPGRFIAAPPIKLEAEIKNIYGNTIIIDCSVYNSAIDTFIVPIRLLVEGEKESGKAYTIKGCTPDSLDVFRYRICLDNPKIGDKIIFLNAGAYAFASNFCDLPQLETIIVD